MRCRCCPVDVVMLNDCFINPSGLYRYPSGPSPSISRSSSLPLPLSGVFPDVRRTGVCANDPPPLLPSISLYVKKLPETLLALHDFPSVHLLIPASLSSQTKTDPDLMDCLSFSESRRCTRGNNPRRQASKSLIASAGVRTCPWYVSIMMAVVCVVQIGKFLRCCCSTVLACWTRKQWRSKHYLNNLKFSQSWACRSDPLWVRLGDVSRLSHS